jgi:hypothetical protein
MEEGCALLRVDELREVVEFGDPEGHRGRPDPRQVQRDAARDQERCHAERNNRGRRVHLIQAARDIRAEQQEPEGANDDELCKVFQFVADLRNEADRRAEEQFGDADDGDAADGIAAPTERDVPQDDSDQNRHSDKDPSQDDRRPIGPEAVMRSQPPPDAGGVVVTRAAAV